MRESLKKSINASPSKGFENYPRGSVVLCNACGLPIFKLDRGISLGDRMGRMADVFKPLALVDLTDLMEREDVDAGVRAQLRSMGPDGRLEHSHKLHEMKTGDPCLCPACDQCFVQVTSVEMNEVLDRSYTVELLTIPPKGIRPAPVRGKRLGYRKEWLN